MLAMARSLTSADKAFSAAELCATPPETPNKHFKPRSSDIGSVMNSPGNATNQDNSGATGLDTSILSQLNNKESKPLLDTVDALRELHVGEIVQLPQIIVVGDQSAGKSSVLEAISRVRFPTKGGLCTRFATELILRKAEFASASVKIVRAKTDVSASDPEEPFERNGFNIADLSSVIEEAKALMGLVEDGIDEFSKDVLRVDVSGPDVHPLTLVDLPGFFQSPVQGQSAEGKRLVDQLAESYMKQKNSIMLAVVSANYQVTNQRVLREVKKHDPDMKRTLGIVTKPDLPQPGSDDQRQAIQLASGKDSLNRLPLGWHVLRNRSEFEGGTMSKDRDAQEEDFFRTGNWSVIPRKDRGAATLREKLSRILLDHIRRSLPGLIEDIEESLTAREEELGRLGKDRSRPEDLRGFLVEIAVQYERLARDAVNGHYGDEFFGSLEDEDKKLRSLLRNLNRAFVVTLQEKGFAERILWSGEENEDTDQSATSNSGNEGHMFDVGSEPSFDDSPVESSEKDEDSDYLRRYLQLYNFPRPVPVPESVMKSRIVDLASINQGKEFPGSVNPDLAMEFFKSQSAPWEGIARFHVKLISDYCMAFVERLFQYIIGTDTDTLESILRIRVDTWFATKREDLENKIQELLRPYKAGYGVALERSMQAKTTARTTNRILKQIQEFLSTDQAVRDTRLQLTHILQVLALDGASVTADFGTEKIIDLMMTHYAMSLQTFTENIINLAVESCLVGSIRTILTPQAVNRMSDEELTELAGESEDVRIARERLMQQVNTLKDGLIKCQRYRPRNMTGKTAQP